MSKPKSAAKGNRNGKCQIDAGLVPVVELTVVSKSDPAFNEIEGLPRTGPSLPPATIEAGSKRVCAGRLKPHPAAGRIYGDQPGDDLVESIRQHGVLQPLLVTADYIIVSGSSRWKASVAAGQDLVPVRILTGAQESDLVEVMLNSNVQRVKTNEQIAREVLELTKIEKEKAETRQRAGTRLPAKSPEGGDTRAIVAKRLGIGVKKADQCVAVAEKLDQLIGAGNIQEADNIRHTLGKSINRAAKRVTVLNAMEKSVVTPALDFIPSTVPDGETIALESKADILTRIQENIVDGLESWPVEKLLQFETAVTEFRENWIRANEMEAS